MSAGEIVTRINYLVHMRKNRPGFGNGAAIYIYRTKTVSHKTTTWYKRHSINIELFPAVSLSKWCNSTEFVFLQCILEECHALQGVIKSELARLQAVQHAKIIFILPWVFFLQFYTIYLHHGMQTQHDCPVHAIMQQRPPLIITASHAVGQYFLLSCHTLECRHVYMCTGITNQRHSFANYY